ncbi:MAG: hypothetical protein FJ202_13520 [Gemmatimonadetes bacterium]|nr:hypothetical protein [Gemmatimonadota bacterium]
MTSEHNFFPRTLSLAVHELRTPITVTAGYLRILLRDQASPLTDRQRHMLEEAERACGRINALIAELSELGKLAAGELALPTVTFDLAALVAEVAGDMHDGQDRGIRIEVRATQPLIVAGDRIRLAAALRALAQAALRERAAPGVIVVQCSTVVAAAAGRGTALYWRYEKFIRSTEGRTDSTVGATGAIYAIRRALFEPIPDDTILDDVVIPLRVVSGPRDVIAIRQARNCGRCGVRRMAGLREPSPTRHWCVAARWLAWAGDSRHRHW